MCISATTSWRLATASEGRTVLAKRVVHGVYRQPGMLMHSGHVEPHVKQHISLGARGTLTAGGGGGRSVLPLTHGWVFLARGSSRSIHDAMNRPERKQGRAMLAKAHPSHPRNSSHTVVTQ